MKVKSLFLSIFSFLFVILPFAISAQTIQTPPPPDTQAIIKQLQSIILSLQKQIADLKVQIESSKKEIEQVKTEVKELKLSRTLVRGSQGDDVKQFQQFLIDTYPDFFPIKQATGYYGPATETAVKKLQERQGIESIGIVGPKTLAKLNELIVQGAGSTFNLEVQHLSSRRIPDTVSSSQAVSSVGC